MLRKNGMHQTPTENRRIVILTYGSRGDVEPFVALGEGLTTAGYAVRVVAPAPFAAFVATHNLEFVPIEGDPDQLARMFADRAGSSWPRMIAGMIRHVLPLASAAFRILNQATQDADLIIHTFLMTDAGHTLARLRSVPDISAQFFPVFLSTSAFPGVALPDLPLGGVYRRATHALNTSMFRFGARLLSRMLRSKTPDLPRLAPWMVADATGPQTQILFAYSPHVLPRPAEWPTFAHVTGYWQLGPPPGWDPPDALNRFLEAGSPPVYFGPGSMQTEKIPVLLRTVVAAVRACGQRAVLGVPARWITEEWDGADVISAEGIPHTWLFPRMRYILHHGGAGTTGAAAASGVPNTALPFSADQAFWAQRIRRLGIGPPAPSIREIHPAQLEALIAEAISNPAYRDRAHRLGEQIRSEDGIGAAIRVIESRLMEKRDPRVVSAPR